MGPVKPAGAAPKEGKNDLGVAGATVVGAAPKEGKNDFGAAGATVAGAAGAGATAGASEATANRSPKLVLGAPILPAAGNGVDAASGCFPKTIKMIRKIPREV